MSTPTKDEKSALAIDNLRRAELRVDILTNGIAKALDHDGCCDKAGHLRRVMEIAQRELVPALTLLEQAETDYEPFRSRRRLRRRIYVRKARMSSDPDSTKPGSVTRPN